MIGGLAAENDRAIATALVQQEQNDYDLAAALYESHKGKLYRLWNFPTLKAYLADRFNGEDVDGQARLCARTYHRLIKDFLVAQEIPIFREYFDRLGRSKRRLLAPMLTLDNAREWVGYALKDSARELEERIRALKAEPTEQKVTRTFRLYRQQLEVLEAALEAAGRVMLADGQDPDGPDHLKLERICAEYIAAFGGEVFRVDGEWRQASYGFQIQCPSCRQVVIARRRSELDVDATWVLTCNRCASGIVMRAVNLDLEDGHGDQNSHEGLRGELELQNNGQGTPGPVRAVRARDLGACGDGS